MSSNSLSISPKNYTQLAGVLYLVIAVAGAFAIGYVPSVIVAAGDASATAANLIANKPLFGLGVLGDVVVMLAEIVLSVLLFALLKPVSGTLSLIALVARLTMVNIMAVNLLIYIFSMVLVDGFGASAGFAPEQVQATVQLLMEAHRYGIYVWDMFFGFHLLVLGYLIAKSGYFPRLMGLALMVGSFGYFLQGLVKVTFVDNALLGMLVIGLLVVATVSELAFAFWLLIKGADAKAWTAAVAKGASA